MPPQAEPLQGILLFPSQELMWYFAQLEPTSPAYLVPISAWLRGPLHLESLKAALKAVALRHECLRTRYPLVDGRPIRVIDSDAVPDVAVVTVPDISGRAPELVAMDMAVADSKRTFILSERPPWRTLVIRVADGQHLLLMNFHHITIDGGSMPRLFADIAKAYRTRCGDDLNATTEPTFSDFASWHRAFMDSEAAAAQLGYWRQQLRDLEPLTLPTDRPRPRHQSSKGRRIEIPLPLDISAAAYEHAQALGVSRFTFYLASLAALLQRCTCASDIPIAIPINNRSGDGVEEGAYSAVVGMCTNTLIIRATCPGDMPFNAFATHVQTVLRAGRLNSYIPYDQALRTQHLGATHHPPTLANIFFDYESPRVHPKLDIPGLDADFFFIDNGTSKFDIIFSIHMLDTPSCSVRYNSDLYDDASITRLLKQYIELLGGIARRPQQRICDLPLVSSSDRDLLTETWNHTDHDVPMDVCIHQFFEAQAARTPDRIALVDAHGQMDYRTLNERANHLADLLITRGAGPEILIGLLLDRSMDLVIALIAILKTGSAYVPCDRKLTKSRIAYLVTDARLKLVITQSDLASLLPPGVEQVILPLASTPAAAAKTSNPVTTVTSRHAAYVIYTSGSTGDPKGVVVEHRSAVNAIISTIHRYADLSCDRTLFQSSITFDSSVTKIFQSLCNGGTLYVAPEGVTFDQTLELTERYGIPRLTTTPSELTLLNANPERLPKNIEIIGAAGENLTLADVDQIIERIPILNIYGPTETTISTTCYRLTKHHGLTGGSVPIGKPIMNYKVYILDRFKNPMPIGCIGELCIAGIGLARGYLNAPELTAARFVDNPFAPGQRLYKSGDLARWLPDGNIEFKGRIDQQVKIRGFRIELGEIEHALGRHPAIQGAVVVARTDPAIGTYLTAYYVVSPNKPVESHDLRQFLLVTLPDYMVPVRYRALDRFPRQVSGKIDRAALPVVEAGEGVTNASSKVPVKRPYIPLHSQLLTLWETMLGIKNITITDNFFALGGHSLLAARMMAEAGRQIGHVIPMTLLFEGPTIEKLAAGMLSTLAREHRPIIELTPGFGATPFFYLHGDLVGGGYYSVALARELGPDVPFQVIAPLPVTSRTRPLTIEAMAAEHVRQIRAVSPHGPYRLGGYCNGGVLMFEVACQLTRAGEQVDYLALIDASVGALYLKAVCHAVGMLGVVGMSTDRQMRLFAYLDNRIERLTDANELIKGIRSVIRRWLPSASKRQIDMDVTQPDEAGDMSRAYLWALTRYRPGFYPGTLNLYIADDDGRTQHSTTLGWNGYAGTIRTKILPGHHFGIITHQIARLAAELAKGMNHAPLAPALTR